MKQHWFKSGFIALIMACAIAFTAFGQDSASAAPAPANETEVVAATSEEPSTVSATEVTATEPAPEPQNGVLDFFFSISGMVLLVQIVSGWILKTLQFLGKTAKQLVSWVVALILSYVGFAYGYGIFAGIDLIEMFATGIGLGMVANYLYDAKTLEGILSIFFIKKKAA